MTKFKVLIVMLMAIILANCASTAPEAIFMPKESENVFPFFAKGQAIAAVRSDKSFILLSLDRTRVAGLTYLRLWILYKNLSEEPYLLEPLRFVTVRITSLKNQKEGIANPESPTKILANIKNEKAIAMISQAIGGTLQTLAAEPTTATTSFKGQPLATTTFNDKQEKQNAIVDKTNNIMANTAMWYDIYQNSLSDGILRRNTVFPGQSINGYIYFPPPSQIVDNPEKIHHIIWGYESNDKSDNELIIENCIITLKMEFYGESRDIDFTPIEGE